MSEPVLVDDHHCFACGSQNKEGLDVQWVVEGKTAHTFFVPPKKFQGWKGIVHGGIVATRCDEVSCAAAAFCAAASSALETSRMP